MYKISPATLFKLNIYTLGYESKYTQQKKKRP